MPPSARNAQVAAIQHRFRVEHGQASLLLELYLSSHPLPRSSLSAAVGISLAGVKGRISELRSMFEHRMEGEAIDTVPGPPAAYVLTPEGRAVCRMAFYQMASDLMQGLAV